MTNQQAPEIYTLHTVPNKGERPWSGIYTVRADAEHDAKVMRDVTGRDWSVVRLVVADTNDTVPEAWTNLLAYVLQDELHNRLTPRVIDIAYTAFMQAKRPNNEDGSASDWFNDTRPKVRELIAKLRKDLIEELAGAPQSATCGNTPYDEGPFTLAQQPAPSAAADLIAALEEARSAINSMKVEAETAGQGDEQMMLEACETISNEGLQADMAIRAALASAPQPSPTPQADSQPAVDDLHALIDQYWDIAYTEGKEDRAHDTETGDAHNVRSSINCAISRLAARAPADSVMEDADPLQGAANWLAEAHGQFCVAVLQGCLMIGYNRAKRLHDAAIAARKQGGANG